MHHVIAFLLLSILDIQAHSKMYDDPRVATNSGFIQGLTETSFNKPVDVFLGIPFAEPPIENLRFKKPVPKKPWKGIYKAVTMPSACLQDDMPTFKDKFISGENSTEDCLYLNIFTAARYCYTMPCGPKPVLFFIYGGGFSFGANNWKYYNATHLATYGDVVVVIPNYRVGMMGFLNAGHPDAPGNQGLWDQYLALQWVKRNIASFGGDPEQVTIAGQSAGAGSVGLHIISPLTKGLFKRAIMSSGSPYWKIPDNTKGGPGKVRMLAHTAGCTNTDEMKETLGCLRNLSSSEIVQVAKHAFGAFTLTFIPSHGDELLPVEPSSAMQKGAFHKVDLLVSTVKDEGTAFIDQLLWRLFRTSSLEEVSVHNVHLVLSVMLRYFLDKESRPIINKYLGNVNPEDSLQAFKAGSDLLGDYLFVCPVNYFAEAMAKKHDDVYYYVFSQRPTHNMFPEYIGTTHFDDCYYSLGTVFSAPHRWTFPERELSKDMMNLWGTFARTGRPPSVFRGKRWPKYSGAKPMYLNITAGKAAVGTGPHLKHCNFMRSYIKQSLISS